MFLFRWIKNLILLAVFAALVYLAAHYPVDGKPLYQKLDTVIGSERVKDLKHFFGGLLESAGEGLQENVTETERQKLEKEIYKSLKKKSSSEGF